VSARAQNGALALCFAPRVRSFTPRGTTELEPELRQFAVERIEALRRAGEGDFADTVARSVPSRSSPIISACRRKTDIGFEA
jgi:hypothetical protein